MNETEDKTDEAKYLEKRNSLLKGKENPELANGTGGNGCHSPRENYWTIGYGYDLFANGATESTRAYVNSFIADEDRQISQVQMDQIRTKSATSESLSSISITEEEATNLLNDKLKKYVETFFYSDQHKTWARG